MNDKNNILININQISNKINFINEVYQSILYLLDKLDNIFETHTKNIISAYKIYYNFYKENALCYENLSMNLLNTINNFKVENTINSDNLKYNKDYDISNNSFNSDIINSSNINNNQSQLPYKQNLCLIQTDISKYYYKYSKCLKDICLVIDIKEYEYKFNSIIAKYEQEKCLINNDILVLIKDNKKLKAIENYNKEFKENFSLIDKLENNKQYLIKDYDSFEYNFNFNTLFNEIIINFKKLINCNIKYKKEIEATFIEYSSKIVLQINKYKSITNNFIKINLSRLNIIYETFKYYYYKRH